MAVSIKTIVPVVVLLTVGTLIHINNKPKLDLSIVAQNINREAHLPMEPMKGLRIEPVEAIGNELVVRYVLTESEDITLPKNATNQMQAELSSNVCNALDKLPAEQQASLKKQNVGFYAKFYNRKDVFLSSVRVNTNQC